MFNLKLKIALYIFIFSVCRTSTAAELRAPFGNCAKPTKIQTVYINGINTSPAKAVDASEEIATTISPILNDDVDKYGEDCFRFRNSYNQTEGFLNDFFEASVQAVNENGGNWSEVAAFLLDGVEELSALNIPSNPVVLNTLASIAQDLVVEGLEDQIEETTNKIVGEIESDLSADAAMGRHVVIVAHSQGNFYANAVHDRLSSESVEKISIVSVATPASRVATQPGERQAYTTNYSDVINIVPDNLSANTRATYCDGDDLSDLIGIAFKKYFCHGFIESYMLFPETKDNIIRDYFEKVDAFKNGSNPIAVIDRLSNLPNPDSNIPEAVRVSTNDFLVVAEPFNGRGDVHLAKGESTEPTILDIYKGVNDQAAFLTSFQGALFWTAIDDTGVRKLYRKSPTEDIEYCFEYLSICDANVSRLEVVGTNLIAYVAAGDTYVNAYFLREGAQEFVPVRIDDGSVISKKVWSTLIPGAIQINSYIYVATPVLNEPAKIWRYELDFSNPTLIPKTGVGGFIRDLEVIDFVSHKGELYYLTRRQGNSFTYLLWAWDGNSFPRLVVDLGLFSGRLIPTASNLYFTDRNRFLYKINELNEGFELVGGTSRNYLDLITHGDTLYFTEGTRGTAGDGPMAISRIVDSSQTVELVASHVRSFQTPRIFRGELYYFYDSLQKIGANGQIDRIDFPSFVPHARSPRLFPGNDDTLLFRAYDSTYGNELWSLR